MRANKKDFELHIASNEVPKDLDIGLIAISIFKGNIVLRFAASDDGGGSNPIISNFNIECLDDSRKDLEKKLSSSNIEMKPAQKLVTFIVEKILDKMGQTRSEGLDYNDDITKDKVEYIYKYSKLDNKKKKKILHEAAILTSNNNNDLDGQSTIRQPAFLYYDKEQDKIKAIPVIIENNRILKPAEEDEYQYLAYTYDMDIDEANLLKDQIKNEKITIESFYKEGFNTLVYVVHLRL
jgi:hypothetical protein